MGSEISKLLLGFILASSVIIGFSFFLADMGAEYGFESNSTTLQNINKFNEFSGYVNAAENTTAEAGIEVTSGLTNPYTGAWSALLGLINLPSTMGGMVNEAFNIIPINDQNNWFVGTIIIILILLVLIGLISIFVGKDI